MDQTILKIGAFEATYTCKAIAFLVGIIAHRSIFIYGEWHLKAVAVLQAHLAIWAVILFPASRYLGAVGALQEGSLIALAYATGLFGSISVYRTLFHPLRHYPGPLLARMTKLWHVVRCLDSKNYVVMEEMHKKYGDFVRTGPNELTIFHPDTLVTIYEGNRNPFTKPAWYDNLRPYTGLNTHRSKLQPTALASYQPNVTTHADCLANLIEEQVGKPVVVNQYFYWFSWDVMGQLAFSKSFGMLEEGKWHYAIKMLRKGLELVGPFTPVPWLTRVAFAVPVLDTVRNFLKMEDWCARRMDERISVSSYLIGWSAKHDRLTKDLHTLYGDSIALIIAGSDTVAYTLVYIFYYLAKFPSELEKLRQEQKQEGLTDMHDFRKLQALPHLNGVINEVLRLHPAVPTGGLRETPAEGFEIGGRWVPGNTLICAPRWTISRLESCFVQGNDFIPERWYSKPEMILNKKAFAPFALGAYYCIGKNLAYMEMQYVVSSLVSKFDVRFAPGEDGKGVVDDMVDQFTAAPGQLRVVFEKRKDVVV
ncbi:hypothetical protein UA08_05857 [Talaromyces atroroseus]|uniref:Tryprostatin B 6-hydroxylase n=1 Tax=Talaromyces atroroseus TaxID=1441469 RepID=A0A225AKG4_TALAT|nr:hypothetical protein UA08_05857 [Talaromyces atroroseus]OKL58794.1 hypothetical protein UA08_05857 [Talaromyces atroroseus]